MSEATKPCPVCGEEILAVAKKCRYCGEYLDPSARPAPPPPDVTERLLLPVGRPATAIAAGYLGLFSCFPMIGLIAGVAALICGILALKTLKKDASLSGKGRAWFGIILGGLMIPINLLFIIALIAGSTAK